jgi:hypothetical protein
LTPSHLCQLEIKVDGSDLASDFNQFSFWHIVRSLGFLIPEWRGVMLRLAIDNFHSGLDLLRGQLIQQVEIKITHVSFSVFKSNLRLAQIRIEVSFVQHFLHVFYLLLSFQRIWVDHLLKLIFLLIELLPIFRVVFLRQVDFDSLLICKQLGVEQRGSLLFQA